MNNNLFIPEHKTNILPLRWFANISGSISGWAISKVMWLDEEENFGFKYKMYSKIYRLTSIPYYQWGTFYSMTDALEGILTTPGAEWSDYDENGYPYWLYEWQEDPETGDAWRLMKSAKN
jgi:hypothetical protein